MSQNTGVPTLVYFFTLRWSRQPYFSPYFCSIRVEAFLMLQTNGVCMVLGMELQFSPPRLANANLPQPVYHRPPRK